MDVAQTGLVRELTVKLEQLQQEKQQLERAIEGQGDSIALKLRLALLAYEQQRPSHQHHRRRRSKSRGTVSSSPASSISASSNSASSSTFFPSSPSAQLSPPLASSSLDLPPSPDVVAALRENSELRTRLANSERVNAYYVRELADLRRRCGISIDELEELDLTSDAARLNGAGGAPGGSSGRRQRSNSRSTRSDWAAANGVGTTSSIRIPGASSVSPPSARVAPSSFSSSYDPHMHHSGTRFAPHSANSYGSSVNTTLTTPSSSFPVAVPPAPTPATMNAFSPASPPPTTHRSSARRNSLSSLVASHFATDSPGDGLSTSRSTSSFAPVASTSALPYSAARTSGRIELEDLLDPHFAAAPDTPTAPLPLASTSSSTSATSPPPPVDPLVAAITRSLAKLVASSHPESSDSESSTTSREADHDPSSVPIGRDEDDGEGGETPLSVSPGSASRSGNLSRRASQSGWDVNARAGVRARTSSAKGAGLGMAGKRPGWKSAG
ncbi:hypothetical protein JCM1840_006981 [Sporobolomyces johnsonii]